MYKTKSLAIILLLLIFLTNRGEAQFQGLVVQAGVSSSFSKDANITPNGTGHYGWTIGGDARMLDGNLYFIMGGHYHSTTIKGVSSANPFGKHDWAFLVGRFGVGFSLWRISEKMAIRSKLLACINFNSKIPSSSSGFVQGYDKINDSFAGVGSGLGLTIGKLEIDLDYQFPLLNNYFEKPDTKFTVLSLVGGIRF